jgi:hypothetical protein
MPAQEALAEEEAAEDGEEDLIAANADVAAVDNVAVDDDLGAAAGVQRRSLLKPRSIPQSLAPAFRFTSDVQAELDERKPPLSPSPTADPADVLTSRVPSVADAPEQPPQSATSQISSATRDDDPFAEDAAESATSAVSPAEAVGVTLLGKRAEPASAVLAGTAPQRRDLGGGAEAVLSTDEHRLPEHDAAAMPAAKPAAAPAEDLLAWD